MTTPVVGVKYRIQSVDLATCLELLNPSSEAKVVKLRQVKEINSQYWKFVPISTDSTNYYVQNVENTDRYLRDVSNVIAAGPKLEVTDKSGYVSLSHQSDNVYRLFISEKYYLTTSESSFVVDTSKTTLSTDSNSQKWYLIPVPVPPVNNHEVKSGPYRIRNIDGKNLLTMPSQESGGDKGVYVGSQLEEADKTAYQRWTITLQSSGDYIIQNSLTNTYLGCGTGSAAAGDGLVGLPETAHAFKWNLQSVGGFAWSLRIPATELSIGVADYDIEDKDEVSLVPSDATSSQIWFIEKYIALGKEKIHAKREVTEGKYYLQCVHDQSVYMIGYTSPSRITTKTITDTSKLSSDVSKFDLKYIDKDSPHFKLTFVTTTTPAPIVLDRGGFLGMDSSSTGTEFVLLEKKENETGYFICRPELGRPHKVVSNRTRLDGDKNTVFAIDNMVPGATLQMWKLVSAS